MGLLKIIGFLAFWALAAYVVCAIATAANHRGRGR